MPKRLKAPRVSTLNRFTKAVLGYSVEQNVSPYELVARGLQQMGIEKDDSTSARTFVIKHLDVVEGGAVKKRPTAEERRRLFVMSKAFLESPEWRQLRMEALKRHGARCQCCGASPATGAVMNVDHIKPRRLFPELALDLENLQVLCEPCNHGKGNWDMTDWRPQAAQA